MRLLLACLLAFTLAGCGERTRPPLPDGGTHAAAGERCSSSAECPIGHACLGCSAEDARCLPGCQEDDDCPSGTCAVVACITCPCPSECD